MLCPTLTTCKARVKAMPKSARVYHHALSGPKDLFKFVGQAMLAMLPRVLELWSASPSGQYLSTGSRCLAHIGVLGDFACAHDALRAWWWLGGPAQTPSGLAPDSAGPAVLVCVQQRLPSPCESHSTGTVASGRQVRGVTELISYQH